MLGWIVWRGAVFNVGTVLVLGWAVWCGIVLASGCMWAGSVLVVSWIGWIGTVWLDWVAWNRNVFNKMCTCAELFEVELLICIKMDLAWNNRQWLMYHKTQPTNLKYTCQKLINNAHFILLLHETITTNIIQNNVWL